MRTLARKRERADFAATAPAGTGRAADVFIHSIK
jgi:hypothetical protein